MNVVIEREIERHYTHEVERRLGFADAAGQDRVVNFVERLLNNNEDEYFFLYREAEVGFDADQCIFLALSVPVKGALHYDTLLAAKILQLEPSFQHKLGYLVGKMYGRVGTDDWVPAVDATNAAFKQRAHRYVSDVSKALPVFWLPRDQYRPVTRALQDLPVEQATVDQLKDEIEKAKGRKDATVSQAVTIATDLLTELGVTNDVIDRFRGRLTTLNTFRGLIR